ncbi:hypothetical protein [Rhodococcus sp. NPDC006774]|uniref:hypothetical protein n=1 Tax=Rhodococcus sp. NPDC006774 TaxID=3157186 RepID=UPI0033E3D445
MDNEENGRPGTPKHAPTTQAADHREGTSKRARTTGEGERTDKLGGGGEQSKQPEPEVVQETVYVHETIYVHAEGYVHDEEFSQQLAREREEEARKRAAQAELIADMMRLLVEMAAPHAKRLWEEKGRPRVEARRAKKAARRAEKAAASESIVVQASVADSERELAAAERVYRADMSSAEAQARYLAALAARAFSDEQMKLVSNANIVDRDSLDALQHTLGELSPEQVKGIIEAVEAGPAVLNGDLLTALGKFLRLDPGQREAVPIAERKDR